MSPALLADLIVVAHLLYVGFIVGGELLIVLGGCRRWSWVRNRSFRVLHLAAILFVMAEARLGLTCPLTEWEADLRRRAGQQVDEDFSFVGRLVHDVLFIDLPSAAFPIMYGGFAALVLATLLIVPPRWRAASG